MISEKMKRMVENNSAVRAMFEEGKKLAAIHGAENVYDFSLGNPNVPAPAAVKRAAEYILNEEDSLLVHGYMSNSGYEDSRQKIAESLNRRFGTSFSYENLLMTVGAAGGLNVILKTLLNPGEEVLTFAPYFLEYNNYVDNAGGKLIAAAPDTETFQPNLEKLEELISPKTKAIIINNPNNPTGVVYGEDTIQALAALLKRKQKELGISIYLISDEPYRELAYDGVEVPYLTKYYDNTIVGYSYSKSLSLPGDRIGYLVMPDTLDGYEQIREGAAIANRILGFVNAPGLQQRIAALCCDETTDIAYYNTNRELLYSGLKELGFRCIKPQGAFYLFVKSPIADEKAFCEVAKKYHILVVAGSGFGCPGYFRIAYCVAKETIERSLPAFRKLAEEFHLV